MRLDERVVFAGCCDEFDESHEIPVSAITLGVLEPPLVIRSQPINSPVNMRR